MGVGGVEKKKKARQGYLCVLFSVLRVLVLFQID